MSDERSLIDANILVYAFYSDADYHLKARRLLEHAEQADAGFCVSSQVLAEFFAIVTNPKRVSLPRTPEETANAVERIVGLPGMTLLGSPVEVVPHWIELVRRHPVRGGDVFDLQLVATMLANGVRRIYTFNSSDFTPFEEIEVFAP